MQQEFDAMVTAFCDAEHLTQPQRLIDGDAVELHGVEFSFLYDEEHDPQSMFLRIVFGHAPLKNETAIYQQLLQQNHIGFNGSGPGFCVSPVSGKVLYVLLLPLAQATPSLIAATMLYFAEKVQQWRVDYFLPRPIPLTSRPAFHTVHRRATYPST